ncbi:hypothetical protein DPMN_140299 [Dreissena polymorpha]|uniref:Uncharacterized protein n=1 Tax=Dreissena polymorpha TaxID=45954 RepID=A0A9D4JLL6_DREPO|nr:hypothetical protein DPMN_140299 [Dreissena polymorpha]
MSDVLVLIHCIIFISENIEVTPLRYASHELDSKYFLEPLVTEDFPTVIGQAPKIPHIIHQTFKNEFIPNKYIPFIKSFVKYNANWTYMFWTDASARKFISDRYPDFLQVWDNYAEPINRADALRYFVLYEYGGVYADLDFECLRPLDRVTMKYAAVFPLEPFEHAVFRRRIPFCVNNAIMMAQPKHSFLRHIKRGYFTSSSIEGSHIDNKWLNIIVTPFKNAKVDMR